MNIQSNILERLRCSKCNDYLSYAPIMITEDGENICGRCVADDKSNKKLIRNQAYEDVATVARFPCRYKESGCEIMMLWEDVISHEDFCEYKEIKCPVMSTNTCEWKGPQFTLLDHYKETHQELILEHPCSLDTDIVVDNDKNMLLFLQGFVFLVQIRCNTALSKLWHCVHCFAQPKIAKQFNFSVQFSCDTNIVKKEKPVLAEKCLNMQIDKSIETNVNNLLGILGDYKDIKCVLSILPEVDSDLINLFLCSKCKESTLPAVYRNNEVYICLNCKQDSSLLDMNMKYLYNKVLKQCKNSSTGCPYINISKKLIYRHEIWECKWQKQCLFDCVLHFDGLKNHYINKQHESAIGKWLAIDSWHTGQIEKGNNIFIYKFFMAETYLKAYIYTQLPIEDINLYKCIIKLWKGNFPFNSTAENLTLNYNLSAEHDWEVYVPLQINPYLNSRSVNNNNDYRILDITIQRGES